MNESLPLLAGLVGPCPACGNGRLEAVSDGTLVNFLCRPCGACWHPELHRIHRFAAPSVSLPATDLTGRP